MKYIHSLLAILYHQLKVNRKFNVNFNLNTKYDNVRVKQKHLILIPQHHWSPTASHPPPPPHDSPPPAHPYTFRHRCFWKFKKIGKKRTIICIMNTCFLRFERQITSPHRGQYSLCTWQWTKNKTQWQLIWPQSCFKIIEKWYNMQNTYEYDLLESASKPSSKVAIV